jgi:transcriptional regulator with XRE-family HTH domain
VRRRSVADISETELAHVKEQFGAALREAREALGWAQYEFAEDVGCTQTCVSSWERGMSIPRGKMLYHLCRWMGLSIDHLFGQQQDRHTEKHRARARSRVGA